MKIIFLKYFFKKQIDIITSKAFAVATILWKIMHEQAKTVKKNSRPRNKKKLAGLQLK